MKKATIKISQECDCNENFLILITENNELIYSRLFYKNKYTKYFEKEIFNLSNILYTLNILPNELTENDFELFVNNINVFKSIFEHYKFNISKELILIKENYKIELNSIKESFLNYYNEYDNSGYYFRQYTKDNLVQENNLITMLNDDIDNNLTILQPLKDSLLYFTEIHKTLYKVNELTEKYDKEYKDLFYNNSYRNRIINIINNPNLLKK